MQTKKLFKYLPMTAMVAGLMLTTGFTPIFQNNFDISGELIFNNSQQVDDGYSNQFEYIRNDVAKQTGVADSIMSIDLPVNSSSSSHCAILVTKTDGSTLLYMWGTNSSGELGNGTTVASYIPILVDSEIFGARKIVQTSLGYSFSAALLDDGSLYTWGRNQYGQLGIGSTAGPKTTPERVDTSNLGDDKIVQISFGENYCAALTNDGAMYMWGYNQSGQLGNGTIDSAYIPTQVTLNFNSRKVIKIFVSATSSAAVLEDNSLYMWGNNRFGQLGNNNNLNTDNPNHTPIQVRATSLDSVRIDKIALGISHSAALLVDGSLHMWGLNDYGQLGFPANGSTSNPTPTLVNSAPFGSNKITKISLGTYHSAALLDDNSMYMWGGNFNGELGDTNTSGTIDPTSIPAKFDQASLNPGKIILIAAFSNNSSIVLDDGSIYIWGRNNNGQLGFPADSNPHPNPIWIHQLGKESHIKANAAFTAKTAVDSLWVDDKFDLTGFKKSFSFVNILDISSQEITMNTKPTYDNATGTVTMTVKIKYFYNEDGLIVPDTATEAMTITGFVDPKAEQFPWWWIIIGIGGAAIIGVGIWFAIKKSKEAEAKSRNATAKTK